MEDLKAKPRQSFLLLYRPCGVLLYVGCLYLFYKGFVAYYEQLYVPDMSYSRVMRTIFAPINLLNVLLINIFYATLYKLQLPFIEQFRAIDIDWPWIENPEHFKKHFPKAVKSYLINITSAVAYNQLIGLIRTPSLDPINKPTFPGFMWQFVVCILLEDFFFYWSHRLLHHPLLYARVHKQHHECYNIIHLSAINAHWIEFLIGNYLPLMAGVLVLGGRLHIITLMFFVVYRTQKTHDAHSGYDFPAVLFNLAPCSTSSAYHNYHHLKNMGNYGSSFTIWDTIFRTNGPYHGDLKTN